MKSLSLPVFGAGLLLTGCAALGPSTDLRSDPSLDPDSGEMVVALREALVYVKSEPGLSQSAQDYLYLGPVETNISGSQALYLWVGFASTIDRGRAELHADTFDTVVLISDGEQLELPLEIWHEDTQDSPYAIKVPLLQSMRARIEAVDFEQLAQADQVELVLRSTEGGQYPFTHWNGQWSDWQNASNEAEIGFDVRVHTPGRP